MKKLFGIGAAALLILAAATGCAEPPAGTSSSKADSSSTTAATTTAPTTAATTTAPEAQAGKIVGGVYTSEDSSYQITVPDGWKTTSVIGGVVEFVAADYPATADTINIVTTPGSIPDGSAEAMKDVYAEAFKEMGEGFEWMDFDEVEVNGLKGLKMNYKMTVAGIPMEYYQTMLSKDNTMYTITAVTVSKDAAAKQALLDSLGSFKLI